MDIYHCIYSCIRDCLRHPEGTAAQEDHMGSLICNSSILCGGDHVPVHYEGSCAHQRRVLPEYRGGLPVPCCDSPRVCADGKEACILSGLLPGYGCDRLDQCGCAGDCDVSPGAGECRRGIYEAGGSSFLL